MIASHSTLGFTGYIYIFYQYWWFTANPRQWGAKCREKKITPGHRSDESHFLAIFGIMYLIKQVWSWCACLFSLTLTAEILSYMTLRLMYFRFDNTLWHSLLLWNYNTSENLVKIYGFDICNTGSSLWLCLLDVHIPQKQAIWRKDQRNNQGCCCHWARVSHRDPPCKTHWNQPQPYEAVYWICSWQAPGCS